MSVNKNIKNYYKVLTLMSNSSSLSTNYLFNKEVEKIISVLMDNNISAFLLEVCKFNNLKRQLPNYIFITELLLMSELIDLIRNYISTNIDLNNQITNLETLNMNCGNGQNGIGKFKLNDTSIQQNVSLKLEYIQYLIMFDITATGGNFVEANLELARTTLINNGGILDYGCALCTGI